MEDSEKCFMTYLDKENIPYLFINQEIDTFSRSLREHLCVDSRGKRPDFLVLIKNLGWILVDTKCRTYDNKHDAYPFDYEEYKKLLSVEQATRTPIWIAFCIQPEGYKFWKFISLLDIAKRATETEQFMEKENIQFVLVKTDTLLDRLPGT